MVTMSLVELLIVVTVVVLIVVVAIGIGAFLMYRGVAARPGESFLGRVPKGQVFSIAEGTEEFPENEAEKTVLKKTNDFLKMLGGKS